MRVGAECRASTAYPPLILLLVEGPRDRVLAVSRILELIDVPVEITSRDIRLVSLAHGPARELVRLLTGILGVRHRDLTIVSPDDATLLLSADAATVEAFEAVIRMLDRWAVPEDRAPGPGRQKHRHSRREWAISFP